MSEVPLQPGGVVMPEGAVKPVKVAKQPKMAKHAAGNALLGCACAAWAALPLAPMGPYGLALAFACVACAVAAWVSASTRASQAVPSGGGALATFGKAGWELLVAVGVVVLETLHPSRPWHTGLLALAISCYVFAARSTAPSLGARDLVPDRKIAFIGLMVVVAVTGLAMLPSAGKGDVGSWLEVVAALAAVATGAMALQAISSGHPK